MTVFTKKLTAAIPAMLLCASLTGVTTMSSAETTNPNAPVSLIEKWDKTFAESSKVDHRKVTFQNRYGITLVGDLYLPKDRGERKLAAIAVSGPFGAVKEQSSGLYAQTLAEQGLSPWRLTHPIRAKAVATHATWPHRISIPRILVPRWTFWACKKRWIATVSVCSAFVAGAVWP
jgi:hypothetical protein